MESHADVVLCPAAREDLEVSLFASRIAALRNSPRAGSAKGFQTQRPAGLFSVVHPEGEQFPSSGVGKVKVSKLVMKFALLIPALGSLTVPSVDEKISSARQVRRWLDRSEA